jgi:hypothetical protein
MPVSDFLPFAIGAGANVVSQPNYAADPSTGAGFSAGIALSAKLNKVWRQSSFVSAGIAQFMMQTLNVDVLDDGNLAGFVANLEAAITALQPRVTLTADSNFYVNATTGSDSYDGRTINTPWQTLQHAADTLINHYDFNGHKVTVNVANGTYAGVIINETPLGLTTAFNWVWNGNVGNPQACAINAVGNFGFLVYAGWMVVQGFHITATATAGGFGGAALLVNGSTAIIAFQNIDFGLCPNGHFSVAAKGYGGPLGNYQISGGANGHFVAQDGGVIGIPPASLTETAFTVTIINNPNFTAAFAVATGQGQIWVYPNHMSITGACTGQRYIAQNNSTIYAPNGDINYFPGTVAGTPAPVTAGVAPNLTLPGWQTFSLYSAIFAGTTAAANGLVRFPWRVFENDDPRTAEEWARIAQAA